MLLVPHCSPGLTGIAARSRQDVPDDVSLVVRAESAIDETYGVLGTSRIVDIVLEGRLALRGTRVVEDLVVVRLDARVVSSSFRTSVDVDVDEAASRGGDNGDRGLGLRVG